MQLNYYYYNVTFIYLDVIVYGMVYVFVISKTQSKLFSLSYIYVHQAEKRECSFGVWELLTLCHSLVLLKKIVSIFIIVCQ